MKEPFAMDGEDQLSDFHLWCLSLAVSKGEAGASPEKNSKEEWG
jgi:hypothetical protein